MSPALVRLGARLSLAALVSLGACGPRHPPSTATSGDAHTAATGEAAYRRPPSLLRAAAEPGDHMRLEGQADPGARVRLATPFGQSLFATPDKAGLWRLSLPSSTRLRLFGLSMSEGSRSVQAEGYLAVGPGVAAQLRAGAGALVITPSPSNLAITALDLDRKGAAVVSGRAHAGDHLKLFIDSKPAGDLTADAAGDFAFDLGEPLKSGPHQIRVSDGPMTAAVSVDGSPGAPPTQGPFEAEAVGAGWRIVWTPPGGGLQTTVLFGAGGMGR